MLIGFIFAVEMRLSVCRHIKRPWFVSVEIKNADPNFEELKPLALSSFVFRQSKRGVAPSFFYFAFTTSFLLINIPAKYFFIILRTYSPVLK